MEQEIWKDIPDYNGLYQCSNFGRIRKFNKDKRCKQWRYFACNPNKRLYVNITLIDKNYLVHRIVAKLFIENPNNKPFINHIDLNPSNNCAENLEWCTQKENINHSLRLCSYENINGKLVLNTITGDIYKSIAEASRKTKIPYSTLEFKLRKYEICNDLVYY